MSRRSTLRRALLPLAAVGAVLALPAAASAATVSGSAFEDFNDNGVRNSAPMVDSGVGGLTVTAFGPGGAVLGTARTAADGTYSVSVPDGSGRVRIEFTDLPAGYQPARHGDRSGTTVQFADVSGGNVSGVDVGVLQPANYCQDNPLLAIACQRVGAHDGTYADRATIRLASDSTPDQETPVPAGDLPGVTPAALFSQTGSLFGIAQPKGSDYLYSSAFTKRHTDWGPGGPGAIYRTDVDQATAGTPNASVFFDVNSLPSRPAGAPFVRGADRTGAGVGDWDNDSLAWDEVGNSGLGNLSTTDDGSELYTIGMATGELIRIPVPADGSSPGSAQAYAIPRDACVLPGDARPMATAVHDGLVYVGGVCSEASRGDPPPQAASANLRLFVYSFDPATGAFSGPVLNQTLESRRLCVLRDGAPIDAWPSSACLPGGVDADWHPWTSRSTASWTPNAAGGQYPQPMLADISFVGDDLVLGMRDRSADQLGVVSRFPNGTVGESGMQAGYALRACVAGAGYQLESNGVCGGLTGSGPKNVAQWGPGGSLFYWDQNYNAFGPGAAHDYAGQGGTLQIPGYPYLRQASGYGADRCPPGLNTGGCPATDGPNSSAGVLYSSNTDGSRVRGFNLYNQSGDWRVDPNFGKANGLGDLEALCDAAPIEIGNYVWLDPDKDGVQDPNEPPIAGVAVELLDAGGNVIATATTDANGQYYFNESNVPGAIQPNTDYTVRIPLNQAALAGHLPTLHHADDPLRDSNGVPQGAFVVDVLRTGAAGHNDHTHDFGFNPPFNVSIRKAVSSPTAKIGETITYTLTARNDGPGVADDVVVTDSLPPQLALRGASSRVGSCTTSANSVRCVLGRLMPGQTETVTVTATAQRSGTAINNAEISSPGDRDPRDNRDRREVRVPDPDVSIVKRASVREVELGRSLTYTLTVRNHGPGRADGVVVSDNVPVELDVTGVRTPVGRCSFAGNRVGCELGSLAEGQTVVVTITARAVSAGETVNVGIVRAPEDRTPRNNRDRERVQVGPDVSITKTVSARRVRLGATVTYTLLARNNGPGIARQVVVTDRLPSRLRLLGVRSPVGRCTRSGNRLRCVLGTLREGQQVRITVTARAIKTGKAINSAVISAEEDSNPNNNRDRVPVVIPKTTLGLTKTVNRSVLEPGQTATYMLRVSNPTRVALRNVRTCDDLPNGLAFVSASPSGRMVRGRYCWTEKVLRGGQSKTYRMTVRALRGALGTRVNRATATSPDAKARRANRAVSIIGGGVSPAGGVTG